MPETSFPTPPKAVTLVRLAHPRVDEPYLLPSPPASYWESKSQSDAITSGGDGSWRSIGLGEFKRVLEANALEGGYVFGEEQGGGKNGESAKVVLIKQLTVIREDGEDMSEEWTKWLLEDVGVDVGGRRYTYQDLCFKCDTHLEPHHLHPTQSTLTLYLNPPTPDTPTLTYLNHISHLPPWTSSSNTTLRVYPPSSSSWGLLPTFDLFSGIAETENVEFMRGFGSVWWFAYAARAFVMRFYNLAKVGLTLIF